MPNPNVVGSAEAQLTLDFLLDIFLLVVAFVLACVVLAFAIIVLVYYQSPDDVDQTWGSKYVAIFALWLVIYMPVYSAIDFAGVSTGCTASLEFEDDIMAFRSRNRVCTAPTRTMLYILMYLCMAMTYFVIPFTLVLRIDSLSKSLSDRFKRAIFQALLQTGVIAVIGFIIWHFRGNIAVPASLVATGFERYGAEKVKQAVSCVPSLLGLQDVDSFGESTGADIPTCRPSHFTWFGLFIGIGGQDPLTSEVIQKSDLVQYFLALHMSLGWIVLSILGGVGLAAYPWLNIRAFITRPLSPPNRSEYIRHSRDISKRAKDVKDKCFLAKEDEGKVSIAESARVRRKLLREMVLLEKEDQQLNKIFPGNAFDPERHWTVTVMRQYWSLAYGILGTFISLCWIAQLVLFVLPNPPISLFLNKIFVLNGNLIENILTLILQVMFTFHLNICCNQGLYSVTMTFPIFRVFPLTEGGSMIDSVLVNCLVGLYSAPAILVFQVTTLSLAAQGSNIAYLAGYQLKYLDGWGTLFRSKVFIYLMLICFFLTVVIGAAKEVSLMFENNKQRSWQKQEDEEEYVSGLEEY